MEISNSIIKKFLFDLGVWFGVFILDKHKLHRAFLYQAEQMELLVTEGNRSAVVVAEKQKKIEDLKREIALLKIMEGGYNALQKTSKELEGKVIEQLYIINELQSNSNASNELCKQYKINEASFQGIILEREKSIAELTEKLANCSQDCEELHKKVRALERIVSDQNQNIVAKSESISRLSVVVDGIAAILEGSHN
ncbi:MAG: hypothetical protein ACRC78_03010 [Planktothrix sp.]